MAKLDSLLDFGLTNFKYVHQKTQTLLAQNQAEKAAPFIQAATQKTASEYEKSAVYLTWAIYLTQRERPKEAIKYVKNTIDLDTAGYRANYSILFENKWLKTLTEFEDFNEITAEQRKLYNTWCPEEGLFTGLIDDYRLLPPACQPIEAIHLNMGFLEELFSEIIPKFNIKTINIDFNGKAGHRLEFDRDGNMIAQYGNRPVNQTEFIYDEKYLSSYSS